MAATLEDMDVMISEYCYSYNESEKTGTICGLYTDNEGNGHQETRETRSEEEAAAINERAMKEGPKIKTTELEYLCILNKYTQTEDVSRLECKPFKPK